MIRERKDNGLWTLREDFIPLLVYLEKIESGEQVVSYKVRKVIEKLVYDIKDEDSEYYYDHKVATKAIAFIENFVRHYKGSQAGKPFILELWQLVIVSAFFGFIHKETKLRKYRELLLIVARKNGKSALASAIAIYLQFADNEPAPNIVSVATQKDQAKIVWEVSKKFVNKSPSLAPKAKTLLNEIKTEFNDGASNLLLVLLTA